ncbi:SDR family NAD(P)-dependent oxidoreductase [Mollicutes bacterium LVI A0078]|nr:SDR family NAD(P)-dependent oxidoreductase [Mollicutes bacterium LVI A0075]WOO91900.1 SDR family NAD(P)-dependent oxidoreductase [Mollicutes bacterium LVI A0078]
MNYTLITGASSGIGHSLALKFAERGKNLIIVARTEKKLLKLKEEVHVINPKLDVRVIAIDLSLVSNAYKLFNKVEKYNIETLINNAGFGDFSKISNQNLSKVEQMISLNVTSLVILSTLYVNKYQNIKGTQLINVSSTGGYSIVNQAVTYCSTKFFVSAFTEGLSQELLIEEKPLQVKVLAPNATSTEFARVAKGVEVFEYSGNYHTAEEMATFVLKLYESSKCVGRVNLDTFEFELLNPIFPFRCQGSTEGNS